MRTINVCVTAALFAVTALAGVARASPPYDIQVIAPADQSTVFSDPGDLSVRVAVTPGLAPGDGVELLLDGTPVAPPGVILEFPLYGIVRGEHVLEARVIDVSGNVAVASPASIVYVWEASLLFPSRQETGGAIESAAMSLTLATAATGQAVHAR
jgi:hypothetical protein